MGGGSIKAPRKPSATSRITRDEVIREALRIIDADGVAALSMRRLGQACGVEAMSLYHHVGGKGDVLDGVRDLVISEIAAHVPPHASAEEQLADYARMMRAVMLRHPNAVPLLSESQSMSEPALRMSELVLTTLRENGYTAQEAFTAIEVINAYVLGSVAITTNVRKQGDLSEWHANDHAQPAGFDPAAYPAVTWVFSSLSAAKADPQLLLEVIFADGLTALLEGLVQRAATNSTS